MRITETDEFSVLISMMIDEVWLEEFMNDRGVPNCG